MTKKGNGTEKCYTVKNIYSLMPLPSAAYKGKMTETCLLVNNEGDRGELSYMVS